MIANWEQKHCCKLPNDLKNFYLSVEGFKMEWEGEYGGKKFQIILLHKNRGVEKKTKICNTK